jgi:hypothetical protein
MLTQTPRTALNTHRHTDTQKKNTTTTKTTTKNYNDIGPYHVAREHKQKKKKGGGRCNRRAVVEADTPTATTPSRRETRVVSTENKCCKENYRKRQQPYQSATIEAYQQCLSRSTHNRQFKWCSSVITLFLLFLSLFF